MGLFKKKLTAKKETMESIMYVIQNDLIDAIKSKNAFSSKIEVEKVINRLIESKVKFSDKELEKLSTTTHTVLENILLEQTNDIHEHVTYFKELTLGLISKGNVDAIQANYTSKQNKTKNSNKINKEINILQNLIEEQQNEKKKYEDELKIIHDVAVKTQAKLKTNPIELSNLRKAIERAEKNKQRADYQIGVLQTTLYGKQTELNIINQAEEISVVQSVGQIDVAGLTSMKAQTEATIESIIKDTEYVEQLDQLNSNVLDQANPEEDSQFIELWLTSQPEEEPIEEEKPVTEKSVVEIKE